MLAGGTCIPSLLSGQVLRVRDPIPNDINTNGGTIFPAGGEYSASGRLPLTFSFCSPTMKASKRPAARLNCGAAGLRRWGKDWTGSLPMAEENGSALQPAADMRAMQTVPVGGVNPPLRGDVKSPLHAKSLPFFGQNLYSQLVETRGNK